MSEKATGAAVLSTPEACISRMRNKKCPVVCA
jgi:hypothetical protein